MDISLREALNIVITVKNRYQAFEKLEQVLSIADQAEVTCRAFEKEKVKLQDQLAFLNQSIEGAKTSFETTKKSIAEELAKARSDLQAGRDALETKRAGLKKDITILTDNKEKLEANIAHIKSEIEELRARLKVG